MGLGLGLLVWLGVGVVDDCLYNIECKVCICIILIVDEYSNLNIWYIVYLFNV